MGFKSKVFNGVIAICFTEKVFLSIMSRMFGEKYEKIPEGLQDGAGELMNIILVTQKILNEKGYVLKCPHSMGAENPFA